MFLAGTLLVKGVRSMTKKESFILPLLACTMKQGCGDGTFLAVPLTSAVPYSKKWITYNCIYIMLIFQPILSVSTIKALHNMEPS